MPKKFNLKNRIIQALRRIFFYSPLRTAALTGARVSKNKYKCAVTKRCLPLHKVTVDHIAPVVDPERGFQNWDTFIERLFCAVEGLQVLSKKAHSKKTKQENKRRKANVQNRH